MKMDKISFARLIGNIERVCALSMSHVEVEAIDSLIDIEIPPTPKADPEVVNQLILLMVEGTHKIDAIKEYRTLTGCGLLESKNAVEKYWRSRNDNEGATLGDILGKERPPVNFNKFEG